LGLKSALKDIRQAPPKVLWEGQNPQYIGKPL
jgi:hypothetical protein